MSRARPVFSSFFSAAWGANTLRRSRRLRFVRYNPCGPSSRRGSVVRFVVREPAGTILVKNPGRVLRVRSQAFFSWRLHPYPSLREPRPRSGNGRAGSQRTDHAPKYSLRPSGRNGSALINATFVQTGWTKRPGYPGWTHSAGVVVKATTDYRQRSSPTHARYATNA